MGTVRAPDSFEVEFDDGRLRYEETTDVSDLEAKEAEEVADRTYQAFAGFAPAAEDVEVEFEDGTIEASYEADVHGTTALAVVVTEMLLRFGAAGGDVDDVYHTVKAFGADIAV